MTNNMLHHRWMALPSEPLLLLLTLICLGTNAQSLGGSSGGGVNFQALDVSLVNPGKAAASASLNMTAARVTSGSVVNTHNAARAAVLASNMQYVDHDSSLTVDVKTWLSQCSYSETLFVRWDDATYPHVNGFKAWLPTKDSINGVIGLISRLPTSNDFYKLLMKSDVRYLGCGSVQCSSFIGIQSTLVACVYASRSDLNLAEAPYKSGEPCTECSSGIFWCHDTLCRDDCYDANAHCECRVNCGKYSTVASNCSCLCPSGRGGSKCQESTETVTSCNDCDGWGKSGTTLIVSVTLVLLALLCVSLCLVLYHKKYRLSKLLTSSNSTQSSPTQRTNIYSTSSESSSSSSSPPSFDPSKYPSPPPAYTSVNLTPGLDPPPYGFTASPTDAAEEVGHDVGIPPPPYPQQSIDV